MVNVGAQWSKGQESYTSGTGTNKAIPSDTLGATKTLPGNAPVSCGTKIELRAYMRGMWSHPVSHHQNFMKMIIYEKSIFLKLIHF